MICLDDSYYTKKNVNYVYININRTKLGLRRIPEPKENVCRPFYEEIEDYLKKKYKNVKKIKDYYKKNFKNDDWFNYYKEVKDFGISNYNKKFKMSDLNEKKNIVTHRFSAFEVKKN